MATIDQPRIYDGAGDELVVDHHLQERIVLIPGDRPDKMADSTPRLRIMWGQNLLDDVLAGRYRSLVCAVNAEDNSHGTIGRVSNLLPTSQWDPQTVTGHAKLFTRKTVTVIKFDLDMVEVLGLLRPPGQEHMTLEDLAQGFRIASEMINRRSRRSPAASVSFLGSTSNRLLDSNGREPSFETVLRTMHQAGFAGDVYPSPKMWEMGETAVFARYPFPQSVEQLRQGGF